jgi:hypothetical protein
MRMLLKVEMDVAASNRAVMDGRLSQALEQVMGQVQPEAAYFLPMNGKRAALIFFDMKDPSQIPMLAEPFFREMEASVEFTPCMNRDDLQAGLQQIAAGRTAGAT